MKLTKALFDNDCIIITPEWISNGHFMVKKSLFKGEAVLIDTYELFISWFGKHKRQEIGDEGEMLKKILPNKKTKLIEYKKTDWTWKDSNQIYESENGDLIYISKYYSSILELDVLWSIGEIGAVCYDVPLAKDVTKIVMPMRNKDSLPKRKGMIF